MIIETGWNPGHREPWIMIKHDGESCLHIDRPTAVMLLGLIVCVFGTKLVEDLLVTCEKYDVEEPPTPK